MSRKNLIKSMYRLSNDDIKNEHLEYYHISYSKWCCNFRHINPFLDNIGKYEYVKLAAEIVKLYKDAEYNKFILDFGKEISKLKYNKNTINIPENNLYLNYLILYYTQCRENIKILTVYPNSNTKPNGWIKILKQNCDLYAVKKIKLSGKASYSLIYQIYAYTNQYNKLNQIKQYSKELGWSDENDVKDIYVYLYEGDFKEKIKDIHISDTFYETINMAKIYFNQNSLNFLQDQRLDRLLNYRFNNCKVLLNTFINYIYRNIELFDIDKFLILSGSILYSYGVRRCSDVDFFIGSYPKKVKTQNFYEKIDKFLLDENTKFFFTDGYTKNYKEGKYWRNFYKTWHVEWAQLFGAEHISETIFDPRYHYYFMGMKMMLLDADLTRRNVRYRPAAIADLIMVNKLLNKNIKINMIEKESLKLGEVKKIIPNEFLKIVQSWLVRRYQTKISIDELKKLIKFK